MGKISDLQIGKVGEHLVCADLILKGHVAYLSEQGLSYDVVADVAGKLIRIQVKTTQKPLKLMSYLVVLTTQEGDVVLDPFVGSGTTCVSAAALGRDYIGFDLFEQNIKEAEERILRLKL